VDRVGDQIMEQKNRGNEYFKKKNFAMAKKCYFNAIQDDPTNVIFYSNLAAAHYEENNHSECIKACKEAFKVGKDNNADHKIIAKVLARMGRAYIKLQSFKDAVDCFENALDDHKNAEHEASLLEARVLLKLENNPLVEMNPSNVHGRGVFASKDIKKDELVCLYDGKIMNEFSLLKLVRAKMQMDREYWMSHPRDPSLTLCGYKQPKSVLGIGQIINDFTKPEVTQLNFKHGIKACEEYVRTSRKHQNVGFKADGKDFWLYAARDISKGEEVFLHYGYKIWLETFTKNIIKGSEDAHMWKLLYWALDGEVHGSLANGQAKVFKIANAYDFEESEYKKILEVLLEVPNSIIDRARKIPDFSHKKLFVSMMMVIDVDRVDSLLD